MISNQKINTVKPKQRRILKNNYYLKRLFRKLRKRLVRRWQEMPLIRHNAVKDNSNLKNKLHASPKKIQHRTASTTEEDKISRIKTFKVRSQCSTLNIDQDFITLKTPPLKFFSVLIKPIRIFTPSRLICQLPLLTKIFYSSGESIQKPRTKPILTIKKPLSEYIPKYEYTDFHNKQRSISLFNSDRTIHPYFDFVKKHSLFEIILFNKSIQPEDRGTNLYSPHKPSYNNLSKTYFDDIMQEIDDSTADLFKLKENAKKLKKNLKKSESSQQETEHFIHQLEDIEKTAIQIESRRIQAMMDIINIDLNSKDSKGKTLAHHLAEYGDSSLLENLILFKNLNPFIKDNQGFLPKDIANNNRHGIAEGHMKKTQEFLSSLTPENFKIYPTNSKSSITLTIDTRNFFMPKSNSSKTSSSNNGLFTQLHKNHDLIDIINENKKDFRDMNHLCEKYIFKRPPVNFKDVCNSAITSNQPFYLLLIINRFKTSWPRRNEQDYKDTPLTKAINSEKLYPFAMLLHLKLEELYINHTIDGENIFDIADRLNDSFYIFLLGMKNKDVIKNINDEKHKTISHLKEKINLIIELSLLKDSYQSIESTIKKLNNIMDNKFDSYCPWFCLNPQYPKNPKMSEEHYQDILELKSYVETGTNKIEEELKNLKQKFLDICELTVQDIKNIKTTNISHPIAHNPFSSHTSQSNFQTEHPIYQNPTNHFYGPLSYTSYQGNYQDNANPIHQNLAYPNPQSYPYQGDPQANPNPNLQSPTNHFYGPLSYTSYQGNYQANANPVHQNLAYPNSQSYPYHGDPQANPNPNLQSPTNHFYGPLSYTSYQGNYQANANPIHQNLAYPNSQSYPYQGDPQANPNPNLQSPTNHFYGSLSYISYQGNYQTNANPIHQNLQTTHPNPHFHSYAYQGDPQANPNPIHQNLQTAHSNPHFHSYAYQGNLQANPNQTLQNLPHTLASHHPQSSHPVSHSTNRYDFPVTPTTLTTELNREPGNS